MKRSWDKIAIGSLTTYVIYLLCERERGGRRERKKAKENRESNRHATRRKDQKLKKTFDNNKQRESREGNRDQPRRLSA